MPGPLFKPPIYYVHLFTMSKYDKLLESSVIRQGKKALIADFLFYPSPSVHLGFIIDRLACGPRIILPDKLFLPLPNEFAEKLPKYFEQGTSKNVFLIAQKDLN
ncbi:hypothetical protein ACTXT7_006154 [Hymenolepis weldensis]